MESLEDARLNKEEWLPAQAGKKESITQSWPIGLVSSVAKPLLGNQPNGLAMRLLNHSSA